MIRRLLVAAVCAALGLAGGRLSAAQEIGGAYRLAGITATGVEYPGSVRIAPNGQSFLLEWSRPEPLKPRGFALRLDNVLGVVADNPSAGYGVILYRVMGGHLEGVWRSDPGEVVRDLGAEILDGPETLDGRFQISVGRNPNGTYYTGWADIKREGAVYLVDWTTPHQHFFGTGVRLGDILVVGYGKTRRSGVAAYCLTSPSAIEGITGAGGDRVVGAELLWAGSAAPAVDPAPLLRKIQERGTTDCAAPIVTNETPPEPLIVSTR